MTNSDWHRRATPALAAGVFLIALGVYGFTLAPTLSFWDCGEYITASHILGVPHQPGTPLYVLVGRVFDILLGGLLGTAAAVNFMSAFFSALAVMFVYLTIKDVAGRADPDAGWLPHAGGLIGAFFLLFSETFWHNAIEAEVYGLAAFVIAFVTWLAVRWHAEHRRADSNRLLYLIIYVLGLGVGFHLGSLLVYPGIFLLIVLTKDRRLELIDLFGLSFGLFLFLLSTMVNDSFVITGGLILLLAVGLVRSFGGRHFILIGGGLFLLGLSVHLLLLIRAGLDPAINMSQPDTFDALMSVLRREQYPPIDPLVRRAPFAVQFFHNPDPAGNQAYYQYFLAQFRFLDVGSATLANLTAIFVPIFLGLLGLIHGVWRARPWIWLIIVNYLINGEILTYYLNFTGNEVRERDYFYFAAFMCFALLIGLGAAALLRYLAGPLAERARRADEPAPRLGLLVKGVAVALLVCALLPLLQPGNQKWFEHDRTENRVAHEYAWNLLAGLDEHAVIFTNGDNDTYPLWYLQEVEDFRRDVTVVNLALINLDWYTKKMKRRDPPMPVSYTMEELERLRPVLSRNPETGKDEVLYVKDFIVHDILRNRGDRPIYFAVTIPQSGMERYFDMLQMEGLAYRFVGTKSGDGMPTVDAERLMATLYGIYDYSATLSGDSDLRRQRFRDLNGLLGAPDPVIPSRDYGSRSEWDLGDLWTLLGRHRQDYWFGQNAENLVGNYPAGLIRAGFEFLRQAEQAPDDDEPAYQRDMAKAESAYELTASFDPTFPMMVDLYPLVLIERGRSADAVAHIGALHGRVPPQEEQMAQDRLLSALLRNGEDATAETMVRNYIAAEPESTFGYEQLYRMYRTRGDLAACREAEALWTAAFGTPNPEMQRMTQELAGQLQGSSTPQGEGP